MKTSFILLFILSSSIFPQQTNKFLFVIHGGAGTITKGSITAVEEQSYKEKLKEALFAGYEILKNNGSSLDAVEAAIKIMEDSPLFNAGKGAVFNNKGKNELDASIMDGRNLNAGAIAGVHHIKNPISLARLVMEKSQHVLLTGDGAEEFASANGIQLVPEDYFYTEKRWQQLLKAREGDKKDSIPKINYINSDYKFGTVGAVALDKHGNLAAGTSTGGMTNKKFGRVGDSPIIGAGTYADSICAVSCTGHGEYFIKNAVAYDVSARMKYCGHSLVQATEDIIHNVLEKQGAKGGLIAIDKDGNLAMPFNTTGMYRGYIKENGSWEVKIYGE
ncbi:MAG: isoaspartyl peptidase/L-asparaginase [Ignavibacteriales bacterium]|nr:MAG: isoaspartyl peptidase/L-asparaginase [Ignavibacteriales bacterium]